MTAFEQVFHDVANELQKALAKHPVGMHSPHEGHSVIREELEELWEHVRADTGRGSAARKEAIQIAAMGMRYALDLCSEPAQNDAKDHARAKASFIDDGCPGGPGVCPNGKCRSLGECINMTANGYDVT